MKTVFKAIILLLLTIGTVDLSAEERNSKYQIKDRLTFELTSRRGEELTNDNMQVVNALEEHPNYADMDLEAFKWKMKNTTDETFTLSGKKIKVTKTVRTAYEYMGRPCKVLVSTWTTKEMQIPRVNLRFVLPENCVKAEIGIGSKEGAMTIKAELESCDVSFKVEKKQFNCFKFKISMSMKEGRIDEEGKGHLLLSPKLEFPHTAEFVMNEIRPDKTHVETVKLVKIEKGKADGHSAFSKHGMDRQGISKDKAKEHDLNDTVFRSLRGEKLALILAQKFDDLEGYQVHSTGSGFTPSTMMASDVYVEATKDGKTRYFRIVVNFKDLKNPKLMKATELSHKEYQKLRA